MKKYLIVESVKGTPYPSDVVVFGNSVPIGVVDTLDEAMAYVNKANNDENSATAILQYMNKCRGCAILCIIDKLKTKEDVDKALKKLHEKCKCSRQDFQSREIYTRPGAWTAMFGRLPTVCEKTHPEAKFSEYSLDCKNRLSFDDFVKYKYRFVEIDDFSGDRNEDKK